MKKLLNVGVLRHQIVFLKKMYIFKDKKWVYHIDSVSTKSAQINGISVAHFGVTYN